MKKWLLGCLSSSLLVLLALAASAQPAAARRLVTTTPTPTAGAHHVWLPIIMQPGQDGATPTPTTPTATATNTPTVTPITATSTPTATPTTATATPTPTATATNTPTVTPTTATATPTATPTMATATATSTPTATPTATSTATPTPTSTPTPTATATSIQVLEQLEWLDPSSPQNHNVVVVLDYSASMRYCWNSNVICATGARRIDTVIPATRKLIADLLVNASGTNHKVALVRFGIQSGSTYGAEVLVPFTSDPQQFWAQIGQPGSGYTVPNNQLAGYTATAAGLRQANLLLNGARTVDQSGNPVDNQVLLVTDGVSNVLHDAPYTGMVNSLSSPGGACPNSIGVSPWEGPRFQYLCPAPTHNVRSPIRAMLDEANLLHAQNADLSIAALDNGDGENTLHRTLFELMAPEQVAYAPSPAEFAIAVQDFKASMDAQARHRIAAWRPAAGAVATFYTSEGVTATQRIVSAQGTLDLTGLAAGGYRITISHANVIAPADPLQQPRDYDQLTVPWAFTAGTEELLAIPMPAYTRPIILSTSQAVQPSIQVVEQPEWFDEPGAQNHNIVIVLDYSASMRYCWNVMTTCPAGTRRIDDQILAARSVIEDVLVTQPANDPTAQHQVALVRLGIKVGPLYTSEVMVPFTADPQQFWAKIGAPGSGYTVPNTEMQGYTPIAAALSTVNDLLVGARTLDGAGNPVDNQVLLITDGISNVLHDDPYVDQISNQPSRLRPCLAEFGLDALNSAQAQFTCPVPTQALVRAPLRATLDEADDLHRHGGELEVIVLDNSENVPDMHNALFELLAPQRTTYVTSPAMLDSASMGFVVRINEPYQHRTGALRFAGGAVATITNGAGAVVAQRTVAPSGRLDLSGIAAGNYTLAITHANVIVPADPFQQPNTYTQLTVPWTVPTQAQQALTLPISRYVEPMILSIAEPIEPPTMNVVEQLEWQEVSPPSNKNIVIVLDYSASMRHCWDSNTLCANGTRRIDYTISAVRTLVEDFLVTQPANDPIADHQVALVRFGIKQGTLYGADVLVPFTSNAADVWNKIGAPGSSYYVPNSALAGYTSTAAGLEQAYQLLNTGRTNDRHGNRIDRQTLLITDGIANVLFEPPYRGVLNDKSGPGDYCITGSNAVNDPQIQYDCPIPGHIESPIRSMISQSTFLQQTNPGSITSFLLNPELSNLHGGRFDEVSPGHIYDSPTAADVASQMQAYMQDLQATCRLYVAPGRPAAGAVATIYASDGTPLAQRSITALGGLSFSGIAPGSYTIGISHANVIAPDDPNQVPRTYDQLTVPWNTLKQAQQPIDLPTNAADAPIVLHPATPPTCQ